MKPLWKVVFYNEICNSYQTAFFDNYADAGYFAQQVDTKKGVEPNE